MNISITANLSIIGVIHKNSSIIAVCSNNYEILVIHQNNTICANYSTIGAKIKHIYAKYSTFMHF